MVMLFMLAAHTINYNVKIYEMGYYLIVSMIAVASAANYTCTI